MVLILEGKVADVVFVVVMLGFLVLGVVSAQWPIKDNVVYDCCCNGSVCSDTVFDVNTNTCRLTLSGTFHVGSCENMTLMFGTRFNGTGFRSN